MVMNLKKTVKVVGAVIKNNNEEILCALRSPNMSLPNYWEFPGGKIEANETIQEAVVREINEELNCMIAAHDVQCDYTHEYEAVIVNLITVNCSIVSGTPTASEHAELRWVKTEELHQLHWAPADIPAVELLQQK